MDEVDYTIVISPDEQVLLNFKPRYFGCRECAVGVPLVAYRKLIEVIKLSSLSLGVSDGVLKLISVVLLASRVYELPFGEGEDRMFSHELIIGEWHSRDDIFNAACSHFKHFGWLGLVQVTVVMGKDV